MLPKHEQQRLEKLEDEDIEKDEGSRPANAIQQGIVNMAERAECACHNTIDNAENTKTERQDRHQTIGKGRGKECTSDTTQDGMRHEREQRY